MIGILAALALQATASAAPACALSDEDKIANRVLSFRDFDQGGSNRPSTAWNLSMAGCHAASAKADEDYLLHGPVLSERERVVILWHMALSIASTGREAEAAPMVAASIQTLPPEPDGFDWNTYVRGVWGFLAKDRAVLESALTGLRAFPGQRNAINAHALARLSACYDRPYVEASNDKTCPVAPEKLPSQPLTSP